MHKAKIFILYGGDFNARLIERAPAEEDFIGPFVFNPAADDLNVLSEGQLNNRERFVEFCIKHNMVPVNTWFQRTQSQLATYRSPHTVDFSNPADASNYAQMDYLLAQNQWKNSVKNIDAKTGSAVESDHKCWCDKESDVGSKFGIDGTHLLISRGAECRSNAETSLCFAKITRKCNLIGHLHVQHCFCGLLF